MNIRRLLVTVLSFAALKFCSPLAAQTIDSTLFQNLRWRMIGPHRGGRTVGVAGIPDQPNVFYIGVNNGGVWRTSAYAPTWKPVFAAQTPGSMRALAVSPPHPGVLDCGTGEGAPAPR